MSIPCTIPTGSFLLWDFQGICLTVDITGASPFSFIITEECRFRFPALPQQTWSLAPVNHGSVLVSGLSQEAQGQGNTAQRVGGGRLREHALTLSHDSPDRLADIDVISLTSTSHTNAISRTSANLSYQTALAAPGCSFHPRSRPAVHRHPRGRPLCPCPDSASSLTAFSILFPPPNVEHPPRSPHLQRQCRTGLCRRGPSPSPRIPRIPARRADLTASRDAAVCLYVPTASLGSTLSLPSSTSTKPFSFLSLLSLLSPPIPPSRPANYSSQSSQSFLAVLPLAIHPPARLVASSTDIIARPALSGYTQTWSPTPHLCIHLSMYSVFYLFIPMHRPRGVPAAARSPDLQLPASLPSSPIIPGPSSASFRHAALRRGALLGQASVRSRDSSVDPQNLKHKRRLFRDLAEKVVRITVGLRAEVVADEIGSYRCFRAVLHAIGS
ncbi:hypothetical protein B0H13DRAFT_2661474 [Mycena leptocephala]|nr:hypothetical protein B0H13DRAFT_2661474 [Mycena leptocephala]